ncbi:conserved hypothetical protein [Seminavis robusta]|uniref:HTH OST-type domain-containing protein n=1 Tax=Seminavis robusta TaxID=568900 RepID=A0A9N8EAD3_9STRA|nr:conserved hypothetical protein [Seminavis robusta]|eukprot:Sro685_g186870.1 conserved hypothetical protein (935) ;mRNA; f:11560-14364
MNNLEADIKRIQALVQQKSPLDAGTLPQLFQQTYGMPLKHKNHGVSKLKDLLVKIPKIEMRFQKRGAPLVLIWRRGSTSMEFSSPPHNPPNEAVERPAVSMVNSSDDHALSKYPWLQDAVDLWVSRALKACKQVNAGFDGHPLPVENLEIRLGKEAEKSKKLRPNGVPEERVYVKQTLKLLRKDPRLRCEKSLKGYLYWPANPSEIRDTSQPGDSDEQQATLSQTVPSQDQPWLRAHLDYWLQRLRGQFAALNDNDPDFGVPVRDFQHVVRDQAPQKIAEIELDDPPTPELYTGELIYALKAHPHISSVLVHETGEWLWFWTPPWVQGAKEREVVNSGVSSSVDDAEEWTEEEEAEVNSRVSSSVSDAYEQEEEVFDPPGRQENQLLRGQPVPQAEGSIPQPSSDEAERGAHYCQPTEETKHLLHNQTPHQPNLQEVVGLAAMSKIPWTNAATSEIPWTNAATSEIHWTNAATSALLRRPPPNVQPLDKIRAYFTTDSHGGGQFDTRGMCIGDEETAESFYEAALLGRLRTSEDSRSVTSQPPVYINTHEPFCLATVGVQGAGKSHTLACIIESCLLSFEMEKVSRLKNPMTTLVLHYDQNTTSICEAAGLLSPAPVLKENLAELSRLCCVPSAKATILVSPTYYKQRKAFYGDHCTVRPLLFRWHTLTADHIKRIMRIGAADNQLYVASLMTLLRKYQRAHVVPDFVDFIEEVKTVCNVQGQQGPLSQRLALLESVIAESEVNSDIAAESMDVSQACEDGLLLIIADLTDPLLSKEEANGLFQVITEQFRSIPIKAGKLLALDEAHKFMVGDDSDGLSEAIVNVARLMRHDGVRLAVSTQSPKALAPELLELVSIAVLHRFHSQDWWTYLRRKMPLPESAFEDVLSLRAGNALVFASRPSFSSTALDGSISRLLPVRIRPRLTADFGSSRTNN